MRAIRADLLVVRGDADPLVSRANAVELADRVTGAQRLNLPLAGHSEQESRPQWLLPMLDAFMQR